MRDKKLKARTGGKKGRHLRDHGLSRSWKAEDFVRKKRRKKKMVDPLIEPCNARRDEKMVPVVLPSPNWTLIQNQIIKAL